jgi:hypothetical protein
MAGDVENPQPDRAGHEQGENIPLPNPNMAPGVSPGQASKGEKLRPVDQAQQYKQRMEEQLQRRRMLLEREQGTPPAPARPGAAYEVKTGESDVVAVGDNSVITVHNHYGWGKEEFKEFISFFRQEGSVMLGDQASNPLVRGFAQAAEATMSGEALVNNSAAAATQGTKLPETPDELAHWYYTRLDDAGRCYVQAAAILHGAPKHEVARVAGMLYSAAATPTTEDASSQTANKAKLEHGAQPRLSNAQLSVLTYTTTQFVRSANRLFWADANASGSSTFSVIVLNFIADEATGTDFLHGASGQGFMDQLEQWPFKLKGECSWRSARALGVIWWSQDRGHLWRLANSWAEKEARSDWRLASALLYGAYEAEYVELGERAEKPEQSQVAHHLNKWVNRMHSSGETNMGCAAAYTYALIGQRSPSLALAGLSRLLQFPQSASDRSDVNLPLDVFFAGVFSYVSLAQAGHIREVLRDLATQAERLILYRDLPRHTGERRQYLRKRLVGLNAVFDAFFLLTAASLAGVQAQSRAGYRLSEPLAEYPALPDETGRDVLLAGVLAEDEFMWRNQIVALLCAALMDGKDSPVFSLLHSWAKVLLDEQGPGAPELRAAYVQFIVQVIEQTQAWCTNLRASGYVPLPAVAACQRWLKLWIAESRRTSSDLGTLAQEVLTLAGM